jgi:putative membrane protein
MNSAVATTTTIADALETGLPQLLLQFVVTIVLLMVGVAIYTTFTPYKELELVRQNNTTGGVLYAGTIIALAIPLASLLATTSYLLDIVVWGIVALVIQLLTLAVVSLLLLRHLRVMIEAGNVAAALTVAGTQIAVALLNAAAMAPT